jgi:UDP-N-acetylglucosamine--N-acetylmuramyl-(pentapeptide) pyrophosphoryl-undecaprenol N-acetylglucosamine transferase
MESLAYLEKYKGYFYFLHQTGEKDYPFVERKYKESGYSAKVFPFVYDMPAKYREADMVVCRAGATTVAELTALGKPAILIPFPYATHNHQEINGRALKEHGAAELILSQELTAEKLANTIITLWQNPIKLKEMSESARKLGKPEAARKVVELSYQVLKAKGLCN